MKTRTLALITLTLAGAVATAAALATPPTGLTSQLLVRGAAAESLKLTVPAQVTVTEVRKVRVKGKLTTKRVRVTKTIDRPLVQCSSAAPCDVAVVRATLETGGSTGWHSHPLPSLVVVKAGTLELREPKGGQCSTRTLTAGQAFIHPAGPHNFVNSGPSQLEFFVTYFAPTAAGLLVDAPAAVECP